MPLAPPKKQAYSKGAENPGDGGMRGYNSPQYSPSVASESGHVQRDATLALVERHTQRHTQRDTEREGHAENDTESDVSTDSDIDSSEDEVRCTRTH
jgi:hypothetical protein